MKETLYSVRLHIISYGKNDVAHEYIFRYRTSNHLRTHLPPPSPASGLVRLFRTSPAPGVFAGRPL